MVEFAKGKALIGPAITLIGGVSALIVGVIEYEYFSSIPGYIPPVFPQLNYNPIVILILGILGLIVGILAVIILS
ncbi:MAG: hypothetical protein ACFFB9_14815 [Promethearchaeota archaeon]